MSVRERPKDKDDEKSEEKVEPELELEPKTEDNINDWLDSYSESSNTGQEQASKSSSSEVKKPSKEKLSNSVGSVEDQKATAVDQFEILLQEFVQNLPRWISKPWMYVKPTHEGHLQSWYDSWKKLVLDYSRTMIEHVINLYDLQTRHPFTNENNHKDLSLDEMQFIVETMIDENLAKWIDSKELRVRVYYKTDEEWADIIYNFTIEEGYAAEVMTLYELNQLDEPWTKLPDDELRIVLDVLVEKDKAEWVDDDKSAIQFIIM